MAIFYKEGFYNSLFNEVPEGSVEISEDLYHTLLEEQAKGKQIVANDEGYPILIEAQPSPYHELNGTKWVIDEVKKAELKALNQQKFINDIDAKAEAIYSNWTRFESEYKARKEAAEAYKATGYQGEASRYITSFAIPAGISNKAATDLILTQAAGLQKLQDELAAQRMRKYELRRPDLSDEQMKAICDDIIQQMDNLAEAYSNG